MLIHQRLIKFALATTLAVNLSALPHTPGAEGRDGASTEGDRSVAMANNGTYTGSKQLSVPTKKAIDVPCLSWLPDDGKASLAILCLHGFSLHKGCYTAFGKEMAKRGIATYAIDLRGFGELKSKTETTELDFDGCLVDIKATLEKIRKNHPGLPVVILGESMGGAIALRATAFYPDLVDGLISSVPARDRFGVTGSEAKVGIIAGLRSLFGGFRKPMKDVALSAVEKISHKEELREEWTNDPMMRTSFSPKEFLQLDKFMSQNLKAAKLVKKTPVLFIQGTDDKLIRPAGTWKLFDRLKTPRRQLVMSKNSEHLIFEKGQFQSDDLSFVTSWLDRNVADLNLRTAMSKNQLRLVASTEPAKKDTKEKTHTSPSDNRVLATIPSPTPPQATPELSVTSQGSLQINFWIELYRNGKIYRCNNKMQFKTGDSIRFHLIPESDGYAYLVMRASTTGKSAILFPTAHYGMNNFMKAGKDYTIPASGWMQFDNNPGTERLGLVFGPNRVAVTKESLNDQRLLAFVSPSIDGAKDLCPTGLKLSWDDPNPVIIPDDFSAESQLHNAASSSLVRLRASTGMILANIDLYHGE